jgi:hypothetical protein
MNKTNMKVRKYGENIRLIFNFISFYPYPYLHLSQAHRRLPDMAPLPLKLKKFVVIIFDFQKFIESRTRQHWNPWAGGAEEGL